MPDQAPVAVQEVASVELQVIVEEDPKITEVGEADIERVGGGTIVTVAD